MRVSKNEITQKSRDNCYEKDTQPKKKKTPRSSHRKILHEALGFGSCWAALQVGSQTVVMGLGGPGMGAWTLRDLGFGWSGNSGGLEMLGLKWQMLGLKWQAIEVSIEALGLQWKPQRLDVRKMVS